MESIYSIDPAREEECLGNLIAQHFECESDEEVEAILERVLQQD